MGEHTPFRSFPLTEETVHLLREQGEFFSIINEPYKSGELPLMLMGGDPEAHTESRIQDDLEREVHFIYPLDDNDDPNDGRIYLRDQFVFDKDEAELTKFSREFKYNGRGDERWEKYLENYNTANQRAFQQLPFSSLEGFTSKFGTKAWRSYGRPLTEENGELSGPLKQSFNGQVVYLNQAEVAAQLDPAIKIRISDPQNYLTTEFLEDGLRFTLTLAVDEDQDPSNGRLLMKDQLTLVASGWNFKVTRDWQWAPESEAAGIFLSGKSKELLGRQEGSDSDATLGYFLDVLPHLIPHILHDQAFIQDWSWDMTRKFLESVIPVLPENAEDLSRLAEAQLESDAFTESLSNYDKALRIRPGNSVDLNNRGRARFELGKNVAALEDFNQVLKDEPKELDALVLRAIARGLQSDSSLEDLNQVLAVSPQDPSPLLHRGISHFLRGEYPQALVDFDQIFKVTSGDEKSHFYRGLTHLKLGNHQAAISDFAEGEEHRPDSELYFNRAKAKLNLGKYEEAIMDLNQCIDLRPEDRDAFYLRGLAHRNLGHEENAENDFDQVVRIDPFSFRGAYSLIRSTFGF